jgi:exonuclease III
LLMWKVRGLNSSARQDSVRTLIDSSGIDMVCLQETKMSCVRRGVLLSSLGSEFANYVELPATGASGGILVPWKQSVGSTGASHITNNTVSVQFTSVSGSTWWLTCVYGPQGNEEKIQFMQELSDLRAICQGPWLIAGDFNLILNTDDKNNSNINRALMGRFWKIVNDLALNDIPLIGHKFTWSNQ